MKPIKILYISNFPLSGCLSPSINEMDFAQVLENQIGNRAVYFLAQGKVNIKLPKDRVSFFAEIPITRLMKFIISSFKWALSAYLISKKHEVDLIIIRPARAPLKEIILKLITRKKVVLKSSSKYWMDSQNLGTIDTFLRNIDLFLFYVLHKLVDGIECVTQEYKEFHIKNGISENKLTVIGNAISQSRFYIQNKPEGYKFFPVLGYSGAKPSERGAKEILYLVEKLLPFYPNILGLIVGTDDDLNELIDKAKEKKISRHFKCVGQVDFEEVPNYLRLFDIGYSFTHLSDIVGGDSSMKVRQYLACGVPVITFPQSNQFIENNDLGHLVELGDKEMLLSSTRKLVEKSILSKEVYKKALSAYAYQHFAHEEIFTKRMQFWKKILESK